MIISIDLDKFRNSNFHRGRSALVEMFWILLSCLFVSSFLPGSMHRKLLLRLFGAKIEQGVVIKPRVRIKFPWRLSVGRNSWLGENIWIDNLVEVNIGQNCCISQGAYLCTGSHDWKKSTFDLQAKPITLHKGAWMAAYSVVGPGVTVGEGAVLSLGSVATKDLTAWTIYRGNPPIRVGPREMESP